ncbi:MAG: glutamine amidotransferase [Rhizobiaceae bacterium]
MRRLVLVRHDRGPRDDRVSNYSVSAAFEADYRHPFDGEALPEPGADIAGAIVFGGKYEVYETTKYPFLRDEARWIESCMRRGIPVLGICQGAQQLAHTLGARVGPPQSGMHEFGYYRLRPTDAGRAFIPDALVVAQAHFHAFDIPAGGEKLASSDLYDNQAFRYGDTTFGLQFHPEVTIEGFRRWQAAPWAMYGRPGVQSREEQDELMVAHDRAQAAWFYDFLGRLFPPTT